MEELIEALDKVGMYILPSALSYFLSLPFPPSSGVLLDYVTYLAYTACLASMQYGHAG